MTSLANDIQLFTPESANATLPLVKLIVQDIAQLADDIVQTRERLNLLRASNKSPTSYRDEVDDIELKLSDDVRQLESYIAELKKLGVEPKVLTEGIVDFPAMAEGKIVNLCWKLGEEKIEFWHGLEEGFAGRQPVAGVQFDSPANA